MLTVCGTDNGTFTDADTVSYKCTLNNGTFFYHNTRHQYTIVKVTDYQKPEETGLPAANVLIYKLDNGETVVVRPSGTEPKIKIYYTTLGKNLEEAEAEKEKLAEALKPIMA